MTLSRPSTSATRPTHHDNLSGDISYRLPSPNLHSAHSSISTNSSSSTSDYPPHWPLPPAIEEDSEDRVSVRSLKLDPGPLFKARNIFRRRADRQVKETTTDSSSSPNSLTPSQPRRSMRRPSLPRLHTAPSSISLSKLSAIKDRPSPVARSPSVQEQLHCHRCYYFAARHCNGWVMGGTHGDACEQCLVSRRTSSSLLFTCLTCTNSRR